MQITSFLYMFEIRVIGKSMEFINPILKPQYIIFVLPQNHLFRVGLVIISLRINQNRSMSTKLQGTVICVPT